MNPVEVLVTIAVIVLFCVASGLAAIAGIVAELVQLVRRARASWKETKTS